MIREINQGRWAVYNAKGIIVIITRYKRIAEAYFERVNSWQSHLPNQQIKYGVDRATYDDFVYPIF